MTSTIQQGINKIEAALGTLEKDVVGFVKDTVEPAVEAEFSALKPQLLALGETTLAMIWQAGLAYLASMATGGTLTAAAAIASVTAQLPNELKALEHLVAAGFAGAVQSIASKSAPDASAPAQPAS